MSFTDDDLKQLKDRFINDPRSYRAKTMVVSLKGIQALLMRMEAAERLAIWSKGICPIDAWTAWRKSCGES